MPIFVILSMAVFFSLFYYQGSLELVIAGTFLIGGIIFYVSYGRGKSEDVLISVDSSARSSKLSSINAIMKLAVLILSIFIILQKNSQISSLIGIAVSAFLVIAIGKTPIGLYIKMLLIPATFLMLGMLPILYDFSHNPEGIFSIGVLGNFLNMTYESQFYGRTLFLKAFASISCLFVFSLSTPFSETIGAFRALKTPDIVIEIMYLIYRYIFILNKAMVELRISAESRLGFSNYGRSIRSIALIMSSLLSLSFRRASASFDAMESRGYTGKIEFMTEEKSVKPMELIGSVLILLMLLIL